MIGERGQVWGFDLMIASIIFIVAIIFFFLYTINTPVESQEKISSLAYDADTISEILLSEGYPTDWNADNVIKLGILTDNKVNETKLESFYNLASNNYEKTRALFNTRYHYYMNLSQPIMINNEQIDGIGKPIQAPKDLIKVTRLTIYKDKITTLNLIIWE